MPERYLLAVSVGPVQDFIASARRTRDLWFGSWVLSEVSKAAALAAKDHNAILIFPDKNAKLEPEAQAGAANPIPIGSGPSVANKILALVSDPTTVAAAMRAAATARLTELASEAFDRLKSRAPTFKRDLADQQIATLLEFNWVAVPCETDSAYLTARHLADQLLAARKATRDFAKVPWEGARFAKSSIDGQLESALDLSKVPVNATADQRQAFAKSFEKFAGLGLRPGEHLSGVDILKRLGQRKGDPDFASAPHIAALPYIDCFNTVNSDRFKTVNIASLKAAWNAYLATLPDVVREHEIMKGVAVSPFFGDTDGTLFYADRLAADFKPFFADDPALRLAQRALTTFLHQAKDQLPGLGEPQPYYALLQADGDSMGKAIDYAAKDGYARHQEISRTLTNFAAEAKKIIEDHRGATIYTGGDDVLALVPLHKALACAAKLATKFAELLADFPATEGGPTPTLSVGLAVAHALTPLAEVRELAKEAEHRAKGVAGKNGLAVIVSKRSGGETVACGKVDDMVERLKVYIGYHRQGAIPDGMAYELRDMSRRLDGPRGSIAILQVTRNQIEHAEARLIIKRKALGPSTATREEREKIRAEWNARLDQMAMEAEKPEKPEKRFDVAKLADELIVAKIFAIAQDQAEGTINPK